MKRILVTGGAGFIGSHLVDALVKSGEEVRVLDNLSTGTKKNLNSIIHKIKFIHGDLRNLALIKKAVKGIDCIFHLAAICSVEKSVDDPRETHETNLTGTLNVLLAAKEAKVKRVILSSSSSVYGNREQMPLRETDFPNPESPYGAAKLTGEFYARIFSHLYGLETVCLRYFNVYGPRQNPHSRYANVIPLFISKILKGERPEIHWDGKQSRDFVFVADVVQSNLLAMQLTQVHGEVFNVGTHEVQSISKIFQLLKKMLRRNGLEPIFQPKRRGDVRKTLADIQHAAKKLKFIAKTKFEDGLKQTLQYFVNGQDETTTGR